MRQITMSICICQAFHVKLSIRQAAGDSFVAALAWAWRQQLPLRDIARAGMAAASICIASESTISPHISCEHILEILDQHPVK